MSNVTVQEALKSAIEAFELHAKQYPHMVKGYCVDALNECKAAIVEIEKCEPVYMRYNEKYGTWSNIGEREYKTEIEGKHRGKILYSFPPINSNSNQEQIAIRERDRLGFAVVNVIGKLDEIIENTQEVEIDDFLHIAISIDMWNELQAALEDMPKRAAIYTSPQPIEKCEPVGYLCKSPDGICVFMDKPVILTNHVNIPLYTSPQPRDCEDWQYFDKAYKKATESSEPDDWMTAALLAQQVRRIQLNTKG